VLARPRIIKQAAEGALADHRAAAPRISGRGRAATGAVTGLRDTVGTAGDELPPLGAVSMAIGPPVGEFEGFGQCLPVMFSVPSPWPSPFAVASSHFSQP